MEHRQQFPEILTDQPGSVAALPGQDAPEAVGILPEEIFDQGSGPQEVLAARAFRGEGLTFSVTGAGARVDPVTGCVRIPTDTPLCAEVIVTAANSGGSVSQSFQVTVEGAEPTLPAFAPADRRNLIARDLIRYADDWSSGVNLAWATLAPLMLALSSAGGDGPEHVSTDARLKAQLEYWCDNVNCPNGEGAYRVQHQWAGAGATIIATRTAVPRVWNALNDADRAKLETIMQAIAVGGAVTSAARHPVTAIQRRRSLTGNASGAAPNFLNGMLCPVLGLVAFQGSQAAAAAWLDAFDVAAFRAQAYDQGLARIGDTLAGTGSGLTPAEIEASVRNWTYFGTGNDVTAVEAHIAFLRDRNFVAANDGLNGGIGIRADKIPPGNAENGRPVALAAGRGRKYPDTVGTPAARMFAEFATTNGVAGGVDITLYPDAPLRSSADYASIAAASLQALVTVFALSGHWGDTAPYAGFLADMDQAMIDLQAKGQGWLSVQNITLKQGWSDFDATRHQEFMWAQRHAGWRIISDFLRS